MSTMQAALRKAGLSDAPVTPEVQPTFEHLARKPGEITARESLWSGGIVEIKIPATARVITADTPHGPLKYLQFAQFVKGGAVNLHVHADKPEQFAGKKIVARAEVFRKNYKDGRSFLYVDLHPAKDADPTHRLAVMDVVPGVTSWNEVATVFDTPRPLCGAVVIVGHGEKFR